MKIFYRPENLQIIGMSTGEDSMEFPYLETDVELHSTDGLSIEMEDSVPVLKCEGVSI